MAFQALLLHAGHSSSFTEAALTAVGLAISLASLGVVALALVSKGGGVATSRDRSLMANPCPKPGRLGGRH